VVLVNTMRTKKSDRDHILRGIEYLAKSMARDDGNSVKAGDSDKDDAFHLIEYIAKSLARDVGVGVATMRARIMNFLTSSLSKNVTRRECGEELIRLNSCLEIRWVVPRNG